MGLTRLIRRPIQVSSWRADEPESFVDGMVHHRIEGVIDGWLEMGEWWNGEGTRRVIRVLTNAPAILDLECVDQEWFIYKVWD